MISNLAFLFFPPHNRNNLEVLHEGFWYFHRSNWKTGSVGIHRTIHRREPWPESVGLAQTLARRTTDQWKMVLAPLAPWYDQRNVALEGVLRGITGIGRERAAPFANCRCGSPLYHPYVWRAGSQKNIHKHCLKLHCKWTVKQFIIITLTRFI